MVLCAWFLVLASIQFPVYLQERSAQTIYGATISHDLQIIETLEDVLFQRHRVGLLGLMVTVSSILLPAALLYSTSPVSWLSNA